MKKVLMGILALVMVFNASGCASLSRSDQEKLYELKSVGISETEVQKKNPGAAGGLNILPGFGNFYLACGTNEGDQWLFGFLNLLTWPVSIIWGIPEAAADASTINKKETIYYYTYDCNGKAEFEKRKAEYNSSMGAVPSAAPVVLSNPKLDEVKADGNVGNVNK